MDTPIDKLNYAPTQEMAAFAILVSHIISTKLEELDAEDKPYFEPLPRGVLTYGDARLLVGAVMLLAFQAFPSLLENEGETLASTLQSASLSVPMRMVS